MNNIEYIMDLIDWNNSIDNQVKGIQLAQSIGDISVFLQPCSPKYNKNVWDNCAKILSNRTDEELTPYLIELFEWLQDLNWPGALCVFERLQNYTDTHSIDISIKICLQKAKLLNDETWECNLNMLLS